MPCDVKGHSGQPSPRHVKGLFYQMRLIDHFEHSFYDPTPLLDYNDQQLWIVDFGRPSRMSHCTPA